MSDRFYEEGHENSNSEKRSMNPNAFNEPKNENEYRAYNSKLNDITNIKPVKISSEPQKQAFTVNIPEFGSQTSTQTNRPKPPVQPRQTVQTTRTAPQNRAATSAQQSQTRHIPTQKPGEIQEITPEILKQYSQYKDQTRNIDTNEVRSAVTAKPISTKKQVTDAQRIAAQKKAKIKLEKQKKRNKSFMAFCACFLCVLFLTSTLTTMAIDTINDILVFDDDNVFSVAVTIPDDADFEMVYEILCEKDLVDQTFITKIFCLFRDYDTVEYEAGVYYLESSDGIEKMLETIMDSSSSSSDTVTLTFPEGYTVAQVFEKLDYYEVCSLEKLYANLDIIASNYDFYEYIPDDYGRYLDAEGYLFPDTYDFYIGETASSVLEKLFDNFETKWDEEYDARLEELGMTMDEIITIASMIQKEAADTTQMADISAVIHNRLENSSTFPQLQFNSTTDYVTNLKSYDLFTDFYYQIYLESYNTYSIIGLPPGPICNPGSSAIYYALYPSDTDYLYFCHDDDGNIYLASTAQEHYANTQYIF